MNQLAATDILLGDRYRLLDPLGAGGMADVYEGWDERLARPVAIKLLRADLACHLDLRRRFEFEAKAAARLSHPNVVAVYDAGDDAGRSYIVMERLRGESLADVIRRGPMDQAWLQRIAEEVLSALGAAHAAGIVHRDVKPGNILLGSDGRAKVADFGIASVTEGRIGSDDDPTACHTGVGLVIGTIAYMAPERAMGQPATVQSDLYSLGVVLYEALTGIKPFAGATAVEIADAALQRQARNPLVLRPDADPHLVEVIGRAMNPDPAQRYPSDAAMALDLRQPAPEATAVFAAGSAGVAATATAWSGEFAAAPLPAAADPVGPLGPIRAPDVDGPIAPEVAPVGRDARRQPTVVSREARRRRMGAAVVAVGAVAALVLLLTMVHPSPASQASPTTTTAPSQASTTTASNLLATDPVSVALDAVAQQVATSGGAAAGQLATGLQQVATTSPTARAAAATMLANEAGQWMKQGAIAYNTYAAAWSVLHEAGATGAILPPPSVPAPAPAGKQPKHHR